MQELSQSMVFVPTLRRLHCTAHTQHVSEPVQVLWRGHDVGVGVQPQLTPEVESQGVPEVAEKVGRGLIADSDSKNLSRLRIR